MKQQDTHKYDDIINLPHYFPPDRQRMPMEKRAAQFAAFKALTGYEEAIKNAEDNYEQ